MIRMKSHIKPTKAIKTENSKRIYFVYLLCGVRAPRTLHLWFIFVSFHRFVFGVFSSFIALIGCDGAFWSGMAHWMCEVENFHAMIRLLQYVAQAHELVVHHTYDAMLCAPSYCCRYNCCVCASVWVSSFERWLFIFIF